MYFPIYNIFHTEVLLAEVCCAKQNVASLPHY